MQWLNFDELTRYPQTDRKMTPAEQLESEQHWRGFKYLCIVIGIAWFATLLFKCHHLTPADAPVSVDRALLAAPVNVERAR